jgi:hypothetical protein
MTMATQVHRGEHAEEITGRLSAQILTGIEPRQLRKRGCHAVTIGGSVSFGADAEFDVRFIRFLREALSSAIAVDWSLATPGPADVGAVCHLPPPARADTAAGAATSRYADQWRDEYGFGHCYYRLGPGFIHIIDVRDEADAARFLLDEPAIVEAFALLAGAVKLTDLSPLAAELAGQLAEAGLLLQLGDWATLLPSRLERWPLPCTAM